MKSRNNSQDAIFKAFSRIAEQWNLTEEEQLDLLNMKSLGLLKDFKRGVRIPPEDVFTRIYYLAKIYGSLHVLFSDSRVANTWIRRPNSFRISHCRTAIELMTSNEAGVKMVYDYLMSQCS